MNAPKQPRLAELLALGESAIAAALAEDAPAGDPTSESIFNADSEATAIIRAKEDGVVAGLPVAQNVFRKVCPEIRFEAKVEDGQEVIAGELVAVVAGPTSALLTAERVALNFLQRMSGIATQTRTYVDAVARSNARILDTRKTVPGLRALDKYAVRAGGGWNHRLSLSDLAMIKDNHIDAAGSIENAFRAVRDRNPGLPIEIEVRSLEELDRVLDLEPLPERVLLDNMPLKKLREAVRKIGGRIHAEASGGITLDTASAIADTGVDSLSVGALTHSPRALDLSMTISPHIGAAALSDNVAARIRDLRTSLGNRVAILGHHYVRDDVLQFADLRGDSLRLAQEAAHSDAEILILCGVHFMGETAALLAAPHQTVVLPIGSAGCYLADCVDLETLAQAWDEFHRLDPEATIVPLTYVNSSLAVKAFCGERGGATCTSANAEQMLRWAFERGNRVLFLPDQNLASNTADRLGLAPDETLLWDPDRSVSAADFQVARLIAWPGVCNVHRRFAPQHVEQARTAYPEAEILVHPEVAPDVVRLADRAGSTTQIIEWVSRAKPGSTLVIGTEHRLVKRLAEANPDKTIVGLSDVPSFCCTMTKIRMEDLLETLESIASGDMPPAVTIPDKWIGPARQAVERML